MELWALRNLNELCDSLPTYEKTSTQNHLEKMIAEPILYVFETVPQPIIVVCPNAESPSFPSSIANRTLLMQFRPISSICETG